MFEDMREDDLRGIIQSLEAKLGSEVVAEAIKDNPPNSTKRNVDWLHANCCQMDHNDECNYYNEELLSDGWSHAYHRYWTDAYFTVLQKTGASGNYFSNMCSQINILRRSIADACQTMKPLYNLLKLLQQENLDILLPTPPPQKAPRIEEPSELSAL